MMMMMMMLVNSHVSDYSLSAQTKRADNWPINFTFQTRCGNINDSAPNSDILLHNCPNTDLMPSTPANPPLLRHRLTYQSNHHNKKITTKLFSDPPYTILSMSCVNSFLRPPFPWLRTHFTWTTVWMST